LLINLGVYLYFQFTRNASDPVKSSQIERVDQEDVVKSRKDTHQIINEKISAQSQNLTTTRKSPEPSSPLNTISNSPGSQVRALPEHVLQTPSLNKHYDLSQKQAVSVDNSMEAAKPLTNQQPGRSQPQAEFNDEGFEIIRPKQAVELNTATLEGAGYGNVEAAQPSLTNIPENYELIEPTREISQAQSSPVNNEAQNDISNEVQRLEQVPHLSDLPSGFQTSVPDIRFNSNIYSDQPAERRVMINDLYLKEGQSFSGMRIETIGEFYIELEKQGQHFKLPVLRDWFSPR